jgi:hypothetical protein
LGDITPVTRSPWSRIAACVCTALVAWGCLPTDSGNDDAQPVTGHPPTCEETQVYEPVCGCAYADTDVVTLHVTYPMGGELLAPGDTVVLGICDEDSSLSALMEHDLYLRVDGRYLQQINLEDGMSNNGPRYTWVVPDSLRGVFDPATHAIVNASTASDSCRIVVERYQHVHNTSRSGFFTILPPQ